MQLNIIISIENLVALEPLQVFGVGLPHVLQVLLQLVDLLSEALILLLHVQIDVVDILLQNDFVRHCLLQSRLHLCLAHPVEVSLIWIIYACFKLLGQK